jgi:predicted DNA-binding transcriptional regulator AlpA
MCNPVILSVPILLYLIGKLASKIFRKVNRKEQFPMYHSLGEAETA